MAASKSQQMQELKDSGNEAVKAGNHTEAIIHYTYALKLDPSQYQLYSNRSLAFLKLQQYYHALEDANKTIELKPDWAKGYFRKAEVEFNAEQYEDALVSYRLAFQLEPQNSTLLEAIKNTARQIGRTRRIEMQIPWLGAAIGFVIGVLVVIGDHVVADASVLSHPLLKILVVLTMTGVGYGFARLYRYYIRIQRDSLLEPPVDLLGDEEKTERDDEKKTEEKHRSKASARQRFKKGKR
uniref:Uncharacterized protein n=1 Tax=Strigamia maritima TaxID=126957 RepID=T1JJA0_STRMM